MIQRDTLQRFLFDGLAVRGEWVRLDESWRTLYANAEYPPGVRKALGEAVTAVALLAATLKFNGSLTMQIAGAGYISMLVVQSTAGRGLRGMAHWNAEMEEYDGMRLFADDSRLVMTLDPGEGKERYQGMVSLEGDSIAVAVQDYFERSEQLPTRIWLAGDDASLAGLLLQKLPESPSDDEDAWDRTVALAETVKRDELLQLDSSELLHRLYHEEDVRLFEPEALRFECSCSQEKIETMLKGLGVDECRQIVEGEGHVTVQCEFCLANYSYDAVDVEALFKATHDPSLVTQ